MKELTKMLFAICTNRKIFQQVYENYKHGFYGVKYRGLDWTQVTNKLNTIESLVTSNLGEDWSVVLKRKGDKYVDRKDGNKEKEILEDQLWISRDLRKEQTLEGALELVSEAYVNYRQTNLESSPPNKGNIREI